MIEEFTLPKLRRSNTVRVDRVDVRVTAGPDRGSVAQVDGSVLSVGTAADNQLVLTDQTVSRYHVDLEPDDGGVPVSDNRSLNGTFIQAVRIREAIVPPGTRLRLGDTELELQMQAGGEEVELYPDAQLAGLYGKSTAMRKLMAQVARVAESGASVMLLGESGTGKERIAQALHALSLRASKPLITVDCGTLTPSLIASELFGHERGAFTGADRQHIGSIERASGGTLFLDEVAELPVEMQPMLLGALERRTIRRVGGKTDVPIDVRLVCATHRDIRQAVNAGGFRLDLYYRIAVVVLRVPPLRKRVEDIPVLARRFLTEAGHHAELSEVFDAGQMARLEAHDWPGNVRELRNLIEATIALGSVPRLTLGEESVPPGASPMIDDALLGHSYKEARAALLHDFERRYLEHWLARAGGNVARAARMCKMDRSHLFQLLRRHGLR